MSSGWTSFVLALTLVDPAAPSVPARAPTKRHETAEEALYRHGVRCMDDLERPECAAEYFEKLIASRPDDRRLAGDAILRLVDLYRREDRGDDVKRLLRGFWDIGMARRSRRTVPYSTRFLPATTNVIVYADFERSIQTKVYRQLPEEAKELLFTCNEDRRKQLQADRRARRDAARKKKSEDARTGASARRSSQSRPARTPAVHDKGACALARALGHGDLRAFKTFLQAEDQRDPTRSVAVLELAGLAGKIEEGLRTGALRRLGDRHFELTGFVYDGRPAQVANLDGEELVLAAADVMPEVLTARIRRKGRLSEEIHDLLRQVPEDVVFFTVVDQRTMQDQLRAFGPLARLLPTPEGLLVSAIAYDYAGVFVRVPTSDPLLAKLVVAVVRRQLEARDADEEEPEDSAFRPGDVDVSNTRDGAVMMSVVLSSAQVRRMFTQ